MKPGIVPHGFVRREFVLADALLSMRSRVADGERRTGVPDLPHAP